KLLNAGQTCIAPDYVLVPASLERDFIAQAKFAAAKLYARFVGNPDYAAIINERHWNRLLGYLEECRRQGAELVPLSANAEAPDAARRVLPPMLVRGAHPSSAVAKEEIFGPVLPVVPYASFGEAIGYINERPRPLAFYVFTASSRYREQALSRVVAGGVTVND